MRAKLIFAFVVPLSGAASAECSYCPKELVLSDKLAACYLERMEDEMALARSASLPVHLVNLSDCLADRPTRGAGEMPDPRDPNGSALDAAFLIEPEMMPCLGELLKNDPFDPERVKAFKLQDACSN
jgi:hypothetical protein